MNTIRDNYIKREAQYKAAQYLAEKQYQREQSRDLLLLGICIACVALVPIAVVYFG